MEKESKQNESIEISPELKESIYQLREGINALALAKNILSAEDYNEIIENQIMTLSTKLFNILKKL